MKMMAANRQRGCRLFAVLLVGIQLTESFQPMLGLRTRTSTYSSMGNPIQSNKKIPTSLFAEPSLNEQPSRKSTQPTPVLLKAWQDIMEKSSVPSVGVATLMGLILAFAPLTDAQAAMSGGRMGGSYRSAPPAMRSAPSRSSYSGGYSRGYSSYSRSPMMAAPVVVTPPIISPFGGSYFAPRPFLFGGGGAVMVNRGPSFFDLLFWGAVGSVILSTIKGMANPLENRADDYSLGASALGAGSSVVTVSVALEVPNRFSSSSILSVLDRLAQTARTDSRVGLQNLTSQVALELLRQQSSITSAHSSYDHFSSDNQAQRKYNQEAVKERSKFEQETVAKYGGVDYQSQRTRGGNPGSDQATMAVVTLVLHIRGDSLERRRSVSSVSEVKELLTQIASDSKTSDCLQGAEILWTPADDAETLSPRDIIVDYPELRTL